MKRAILTIGAAAFLAFGLSGFARAQSSDDDKSTNPSATPETSRSDTNASARVNSTDRDFVEKATNANLAEIKMGQLAAEKASASDVKQHAQKMVDDHTKVNDDLKRIADQEGVSVPTDLDSSAKSEYDKLNGLSGADFDREYMSNLKKDHRDAIDLFQKETRSGSDPAIKRFASSTLPSLREHLQMASMPVESTPTAANTTSSAYDNESPSASSKESTTENSERPSTLPSTGSSLPALALAGLACMALAAVVSRLR